MKQFKYLFLTYTEIEIDHRVERQYWTAADVTIGTVIESVTEIEITIAGIDMTDLGLDKVN